MNYSRLSFNEITLNPDQYHASIYAHHKSLVPQACRRVILDRVSNSEIIFEKEIGDDDDDEEDTSYSSMMKYPHVNNNKRKREKSTITTKKIIVQPKNRFRNHMKEYWHPFIRDCIDEIMTIGIVAVDYDVIRDPLDGSLIVIPFVIKNGLGTSYNITMKKDSPRIGRTLFKFYRLKDQKTGMGCFPTYDKNVRVFNNFGYDPAPNGDLRSIAYTILWQERWISKIYYYTLKSEQSRPTSIFLESTTTTTGNNIQNIERYGDGDLSKKAVDSFYKMNMSEIEQYEEIRQKVESEHVNTLKDELSRMEFDQPGSIPFDHIGSKMETNLVPIPHGRKIASVSHSSGLHEWQTLNHSYQDYVCAAYGVPRQIIFPEGQKSVHDESGLIQNNFMSILENWKLSIERILNAVYNDIYAEDDYQSMYKKFLKEESNKAINPEHLSYLKDKYGSTIHNKRMKKTNNEDVIHITADKSLKTATISTVIETTDGHLSMRTAKPNHNPDIVTDTSTNNRAYLELGKALNVNFSGKNIDPELEELSEIILDKVHERVVNSKLELTFINIPNISQDNLLLQYTLGVIDWITFQQLSRGINNLPTVSNKNNENNEIDPWGQEVKLSILRSQHGPLLKKTGLAGAILFPDPKSLILSAMGGIQEEKKESTTSNNKE